LAFLRSAATQPLGNSCLSVLGCHQLNFGFRTERCTNWVCWSSDFCVGLDQDQPVDNLNVIVSLHEVRKETESTMPTQKPPRISLPKGWPSYVKSGVLHIISLAHFSITHARGWAAKSVSARVRIAAENDRLHQEIALLRKELRIKLTV